MLPNNTRRISWDKKNPVDRISAYFKYYYFCIKNISN